MVLKSITTDTTLKLQIASQNSDSEHHPHLAVTNLQSWLWSEVGNANTLTAGNRQQSSPSQVRDSAIWSENTAKGPTDAVPPVTQAGRGGASTPFRRIGRSPAVPVVGGLAAAAGKPTRRSRAVASRGPGNSRSHVHSPAGGPVARGRGRGLRLMPSSRAPGGRPAGALPHAPWPARGSPRDRRAPWGRHSGPEGQEKAQTGNGGGQHLEGG